MPAAFVKGRANKPAKNKKKGDMDHLSAWIIASQGYLGMVDPGKHNKTAENKPADGRDKTG
jgi:hypothetical protein